VIKKRGAGRRGRRLGFRGRRGADGAVTAGGQRHDAGRRWAGRLRGRGRRQAVVAPPAMAVST